MEQFINTADDMQWLKDVHIPDLPDNSQSAVIVGNEDWPESIKIYTSQEPRFDDSYSEYVRGTGEHYTLNIN